MAQNASLVKKKLEYKQKSYIFLPVLPNYYLAIASRAHNLVASERKWKRFPKWYEPIAIGPKNEAPTSLKLAKIKDFTK